MMVDNNKTLRRARAVSLAGTTTPNDRAATAAWLESLGVELTDVWLLVKGEWVKEPQVDDPMTIDETVAMAMGRSAARYALHEYNGRWRLITAPPVNLGKRFRYYDTREAAEMVAVHNG